MSQGNGAGPSPVVPSQFTAKPSVTPTPAPATVTPTPTPAPAIVSETDTLRAKLAEAERREVLEKRTRVTEKRQWERERLGFGEKLKLADKYARLEKLAAIDKAAAARELLGEKYLEDLNTVAANGGAPTAASIQLELDRRDQEREQKARQQQEEQQRAQQEAREKARQAQLKAFHGEAAEFAKANSAEYPIFSRFSSPESLANALVQRIRLEHDSTVQRDEETGAVLRPGRLMSFKEAAEAVEADMLAIAEAGVSHAKYRDRLAPKLTPAKPAGTVVEKPKPPSPQSQTSPQGQTSTGSSTLQRPLTDEELREKAIAVYHKTIADRG